MERQLAIVRQVQEIDSSFILGGSLGLWLHGVDLHRSLDQADIDFTYNDTKICWSYEHYRVMKLISEEKDESGYDMEYAFKADDIDIQAQIDLDAKWILIKFGDHVYKVRALLEILNWKIKYATDGVEKHKRDLTFLELNSLGLHNVLVSSPYML